MLKFLLYVLILSIIKASTTDQQSKTFEIQWFDSARPLDKDNLDKFNITSSLGENYTCYVRENSEISVENSPYHGPLAIDFIEHLFNNGVCSYRIDPYWTYELCHGRYIRQYHELIDGSSLKLRQHTLGKMGTEEREMIIRQKKEEERKNINSTFKLPTKRVDNKELPYVQIEMTDGSTCEYNRRKRRRTKVFYVCDLKGNHEIHSVKEVTTCVYEIVVLSPLLCAHSGYRPKIIPSTPIQCYATGKSSKIPYNLAKIYKERKKIINQAGKEREITSELKYKKQNEKKVEFHHSSLGDFLTGKNCISGGTGGWQYEFCYGKYINQYTFGFLGLRNTVCLGKFILDKHLEWIKKHPHKSPKAVGHRTYITQLYTGGSVSNVTGRPRKTEVKLKCMENAANKNALVTYLYEKEDGAYLLGVESAMLCEIVRLADENGLVFMKS